MRPGPLKLERPIAVLVMTVATYAGSSSSRGFTGRGLGRFIVICVCVSSMNEVTEIDGLEKGGWEGEFSKSEIELYPVFDLDNTLDREGVLFVWVVSESEGNFLVWVVSEDEGDCLVWVV